MTALGLDAEQYARVNVKAIVAGLIGGLPPEVETNASARTDVSGIATFSLEPSAAGTRYEARIFSRAGRKLYEQQFVMPDAAANLSDLPDFGEGALRETSNVHYPTRMRVRQLAGTEHTLEAGDLSYDLLVFNNAARCTLKIPHSSEMLLVAGMCINARNRLGSLAYELTAAAVTAGAVIEGAGDIGYFGNGAVVSSLCYEAENVWVTAGALEWSPTLLSVVLDSVAGTAEWTFDGPFYEPAGTGFSIQGVTLSAGNTTAAVVAHTAAGITQVQTYTCRFYGQSVTSVAA